MSNDDNNTIAFTAHFGMLATGRHGISLEMTRSRQEHLDWARKRALDLVAEGDLKQAIPSMLSDLAKHDETKGMVRSIVPSLDQMVAMLEDPELARQWINRCADTPPDTPKPGSHQAIARGCTCPVVDNRHGKGTELDGIIVFWRDENCPLHTQDSPAQ